MEKFTVGLTTEERQAIREISASEGMGSSTFVRKLIQWVCIQYGKIKDPAQAVDTPVEPDLDKVFPPKPAGLDDFIEEIK